MNDNGLRKKMESSSQPSTGMQKAADQDKQYICEGTSFQTSDNCLDYNLTRCVYGILPSFSNQSATVHVRSSCVCMHTQYKAITTNDLIVCNLPEMFCSVRM